MTKGSIIEITGVGKTYTVGGNPLHALRDINLSFAPKEFTGVIGPSGSGKTTLLNLIGALDVPSCGSIAVLGKKIHRLTSKEAAKLRSINIGFIFQSYYLFNAYTVFENVEFPLILIKMPYQKRKQAVMDALNWVGLLERKNDKPTNLSGGECQRVAIARAIVKRPEILLADEPTANLDSTNSHAILTTMVEINENLGTTFLFSTHDEKVIGYLKRKITLTDGAVARDEKLH